MDEAIRILKAKWDEIQPKRYEALTESDEDAAWLRGFEYALELLESRSNAEQHSEELNMGHYGESYEADDKKATNITQRDLYFLAHCRCPSCGLDEIETTCIGYIIEDATTAIDRNQASCACGWKGIVHDLVS